MKVRMTDKDGVTQTRFINPKNYDPERMEILETNIHDSNRRDLHGF